MELSKLLLFIYIFLLEIPSGQSAVLEALLQVESENIKMSDFLDRLKKFIAHSHIKNDSTINDSTNNTGIEKYISHNNSFQANYDFASNLLTMQSSYNLLQNKTGQKISNVKILVTFRYDQEPNKKIIIEDFHDAEAGTDGEPQIGIDNITKTKEQATQTDNHQQNHQSSFDTFRTILLSIYNFLSTIVETFFHIVVNGILGHMLTTAFEEFYYGRMLSH